MPTIAHISDLHFGRVDCAAAEGLVRDLVDAPPTLLVVSGDLTQRARGGQFAAARSYLARLPGPQLVVPGNHDIPLFDVIRRFFWPLSRYRRHITPDLRPSFSADGLYVLGVNTARSSTWKDGRISEEQLLDLRLRLCAAPAPAFKVVVTHHPFIPPPDAVHEGIVGRASEALAAMESCGVDLILSGHLHRGYSADVRTHHEATKRSILAVQASTAISTRRREEPNAYNRISIEAGSVSIEVRAWDGKEFASTETTRYFRTAAGWTRGG